MVPARSVVLPKHAEELQEQWVKHDSSFANASVADITQNKPSVVTEHCAAAERKGLPVINLLSKKAVLTLLENKRGSLGSTLSGVRSWIAFAATVLGYALEACLPPICTVHAMMWLQCCRCPGTAQNNAGYLKFYCLTFTLSTEWYCAQLALFLRGLRKRRLSTGVIPQTCKVLLNWNSQNKKCLLL